MFCPPGQTAIPRVKIAAGKMFQAFAQQKFATRQPPLTASPHTFTDKQSPTTFKFGAALRSAWPGFGMLEEIVFMAGVLRFFRAK